MNNKPKKINIIQKLKLKIKSIFDRDIEKDEPKPRTDWAVIMSIFFILASCFMAYYYFKFLPTVVVNDIIVDTEGNEIKIENIAKGKLEKTLKPWIERETKFSEYYKERPSFDFLR